MSLYLRRLKQAWLTVPTAITLPLMMIPIGISALILGEQVSRAFTNIGGGTIIRAMGAAMLVGGILVLSGVLRDDSWLEVLGLALAVGGAGVYGGGVLLGLGVQGLVAGLGYLAIATGFLGRLLMLTREARLHSKVEHDES